jgi:hypothetical protein
MKACLPTTGKLPENSEGGIFGGTNLKEGFFDFFAYFLTHKRVINISSIIK